MEAMGALWGYEENMDELKSKLLQTTFVLETERKEAKDNMRRNVENVKQLVYFLKVACQERDDARDQLQQLLNIIPLSPIEIGPALPIFQPESPMYPIRGNSSMSVSDSISETYNHHQSYGSSPVDSLLDIVSSPDVPNLNIADSINIGVPSHAFIPDYNCLNSMGSISSGIPETDQASAIFDSLVKGKTLPEKGKLLQTVMEAGPLLKTLLVSGSLPQWRNPPPLQPLQMPPFTIKGRDTETINMKLVSNLNHPVQSSWSSSFSEISYGSSQMYSTPMLSPVLGRDVLQNGFLSGKRQRCQ